MKRGWLAAALLLVLCLGCGWALNALHERVARTNGCIEAVQAALQQRDEAAAAQALTTLQQQWQREKKLFYVLNGGLVCDPIEQSLGRMQAWLQEGEAGALSAELRTLATQLTQLAKTQSVSAENLL